MANPERAELGGIEFIAWGCFRCNRVIEPGTEVFVQNPPTGYGYGTEEIICQSCDVLRRAPQGDES